ncbi:hypothetical protein GGX14DRAFT_389514 [Mycena pura]|uniref:Uncharacterized protein n=1 Tax=Mycena pura TaxID=153505 RepID=A0AAD6VQS3_9AGAR|nr:hypothetical protein GGX14DRAFT_389514 [Mycena pura]
MIGDTTPQLALFLAPFYAAYVTEERGESSIEQRLLTDVHLQSPASIETLLVAASGIFSVDIVSFLRRHYAFVDKSACNDAMACRRTIDICLDMFQQLREGCYRWAIHNASTGDNGGNGGRHGGPSIRDAGLGSQAGGGRGQGGSGLCGGAGRGGHGGRRGRGGGVPQVPPHTTPPCPDPWQRTNRHTKCHRQALAFAQGIGNSVAGGNLPPFTYLVQELYTVQDPQASSPYGTLYHATRHSTLRCFDALGVEPRVATHPNFFSKAPSFNLCSSVVQAISHVLHSSPTLHINGVVCDPVVVLAFRIDMASFWEDSVVDYVAMESPLSNLNTEDTMWVKENMAAKGMGRMEAEGRDFVVGPWLVVHTFYDWIPNATQPLHVAAVSMKACKRLTENIIAAMNRFLSRMRYMFDDKSGITQLAFF